MAQVIKRAFKSFNGIDWDKHYFENSADQIKMGDGRTVEELLKDVTNYKVSEADNVVFILAGGIKAYLINGWCGNNSSSKTIFPSGLFKTIIGVASSTWVPGANWEKYETTADLKIQYCDTISVQVLNYGTKPISYQLLIFGM
ncbi:hypothetical protein [Clostridium cadaveris]|uniref:hypothetical protein n=1 Tax=Clostridium cadaveris TaxID=1529 RepID=UPI000429B5C7|nr:hypothetical protein [Clostridium cadaveris]